MSRINRLPRRIPVLAALAFITACADASAPVPGTAAAPGPYDGTYSGPISVVTGNPAVCSGGGSTRTATIRNGRVSVLYSPGRRMSASGSVDAAGRVVAMNRNDGNMRFEGHVSANRLPARVTFQNGCVFEFALTKTG